MGEESKDVKKSAISKPIIKVFSLFESCLHTSYMYPVVINQKSLNKYEIKYENVYKMFTILDIIRTSQTKFNVKS